MTYGAPMFRALFETAPDSMVVIDVTGRIVLANPQTAQLFGHPEGSLVGQPVEILIPEEARASHVGHRSRYMSAPRVRPMGAGQELIGVRHDQSRFPVEIALSPIETEDGRFFVASIRDISDTQRARQALARARYDTYIAQAGQLALESSIDSTLDQLPQMLVAALQADSALVVISRDGQSPQVHAAIGVGEAELDPLLAALDSALAAARDQEVLTLDPAATGFASAICARLHAIDRAFGAIHVLSRQARVFDREAAHFLQSVTQSLSAALQRNQSQEQLAHAQRLEAIGQLTGGIAHDFNNLLTVISGNLQLVEAQIGTQEDLLDLIGSALRAVGRGAELTRKLLAFARRQRLSPRAIDPANLLGELGRMLSRTLGERVELALECVAGTPHVFADPAQLESALINLALNARDAMPHGGTVHISARPQRADDAPPGDMAAVGDQVIFEVSDSGTGMTPEVLARATEPFFTTKEQGRGSGLGLSMVYGFVKQSGGTLRCHSRVGQGTRIALLLPRANVPQNPAFNARHEAVGGQERVLVVEDEPDVRGVATAFLKSLGYRVDAAASADAAEEILEAQADIALLFTDVILGAGRTGAELARDARAARPQLSVLLTSGYERPAAADDDQPGREFELLRKPYSREQLAAALRRALAARD